MAHTRLALRLLLIAVMCCGMVGCYSAAPQESSFPPFYRQWVDLPEELSGDLEVHRTSVLASPDRREALLSYAHSTLRLLDHQTALWFHDDKFDSAEDEAARRSRAQLRAQIVETGEQAMALFHQYEFLAGSLSWSDRIQQAWILLLLGHDDEAEGMLTALLLAEDTPEGVKEKLRFILTQMPQLPSES